MTSLMSKFSENPVGTTLFFLILFVCIALMVYTYCFCRKSPSTPEDDGEIGPDWKHDDAEEDYDDGGDDYHDDAEAEKDDFAQEAATRTKQV